MRTSLRLHGPNPCIAEQLLLPADLQLNMPDKTLPWLPIWPGGAPASCTLSVPGSACWALPDKLWAAPNVAIACRVYLNPGAGERRIGIASSPWAAQEGQDFLANNVVPDIDFATTHIWMDNWMGYGDFSTCIPCDLNFDYSHGACPAQLAVCGRSACSLHLSTAQPACSCLCSSGLQP